MSVRRIKAGTTDVSVTLRIVDSTDGTPETGVVFNTSGIDLWYRRELAASTDITEATLAALTTAHTDGGFLHINDGWYRLDLPDAACASGVAGVQIGGTVTGMVVLAPYIELDVNTAEDVYTRLGAPAGASVSADIAAIEAQTDDIGAAGAGLTAIPWNAAWDAEVQSEVADALAVYDPPTNAELTAAVANVSVDEIQATAIADLFNTDSGTTYASAVAGSAVKEIADNAGGSALTVEAIADAVWDEAQAGHVGAGTFGEVATEVAAILVDTGTTLQGELDGIQADTEDIQSRLPAALVSGRIDASVGAMAANVMTAAAAAADLTTELQSGLATAANLATVDTVVDAIKAVTDLLPDAGALSSLATAANLATVDTVVDAVKAKTDSLTFTTAGMVDSAVKRVGDTTLTAAGTGGQGYGAA